MFCPKCASEVVSDETRFCSKCGFTLKTVKKVIENNSENEDAGELSQFQKGIRFGIKLLLVALILIPAFQILGGFFTPDDVLVESSPSSSWFDLLGNAVLITISLAGIARIFYAIVFERSTTSNDLTIENDLTTDSTRKLFGQERNALPPSNGTPISDFGKWKATDELFEPVFSKTKTSGELK